MILILSKFK